MSTIYPYTYLIGWSSQDRWYYGVRYAKGCHPSDLWNPYRTSSRVIKQFIKEHGEPDVIKIRRVFSSVDKAVNWEQRVLKRMKVNRNDRWLNQTYNGCFTYRGTKNTRPGCEAAKLVTKGKTYEEIYDDAETIERLKTKSSIASKRNWADPELRKRMSNKKQHSQDMTKYREAALRRWADPVDSAKRVAAMKGKKKTKR